MLAMQYCFSLPADYDMAIVRRRISDNGHRMNGFPKLVFKAFLHASASALSTNIHRFRKMVSSRAKEAVVKSFVLLCEH